MVKESFLKSKAIFFILAAVIAIVYCTQITNVFDRKIDMNGDNICYYNLAQSLHNGLGYKSTFGCDGPVYHMHFPPGYPAFMSVMFAFGLDSVVDQKIVNCVLLLIAILLLYYIIYKFSGNVLLGVTVCMAVSCHAEILRWASMMMSEQLFLVISLLIIFLLGTLKVDDLFEKKGWKSWVSLVLTALLLGYMYLVRSMGLSMSVAAIAWAVCLLVKEIIKKNRMAVFRYAVIIAVLFAGLMSFKTAWNVRNEKIHPGFKSDYVGDFNKKPGGEVMSGISDWTDRIKANTKSYVTYYIPDALFEMQSEEPKEKPGAGAWIAGILLIAVVSFGLLRLGRIGLLMFLYLAVTYAVLMVWPEQYSGLRYFMTLIPLIILGFLGGVYGIASALLSLKWKKSFVILPVLPVILALFIMIPRYVDAQVPYHRSAQIRSWRQVQNPAVSQFVKACEWSGRNLPADSRMMCRKPELYYMFSSFHHSTGFPQYASPEEMMERIDKSRTEYIIIDYMYIHAYRTIVPAINMYPERFEFVQQWGKIDNSTGEMATFIFHVKRPSAVNNL